MRQMDTIWNWQSSRTNCMFCILEVGANAKFPCQACFIYCLLRAVLRLIEAGFTSFNLMVYVCVSICKSASLDEMQPQIFSHLQSVGLTKSNNHIWHQFVLEQPSVSVKTSHHYQNGTLKIRFFIMNDYALYIMMCATLKRRFNIFIASGSCHVCTSLQNS